MAAIQNRKQSMNILTPIIWMIAGVAVFFLAAIVWNVIINFRRTGKLTNKNGYV